MAGRPLGGRDLAGVPQMVSDRRQGRA